MHRQDVPHSISRCVSFVLDDDSTINDTKFFLYNVTVVEIHYGKLLKYILKNQSSHVGLFIRVLKVTSIRMSFDGLT